jgi:hypothetical protein
MAHQRGVLHRGGDQLHADKMILAGFCRTAPRLMVPFVMAVIVLVPLMLYISEPQLRGANYLDFLANAGLRSHEVYSVWLPDRHVWFLPYVFSMPCLPASHGSPPDLLRRSTTDQYAIVDVLSPAPR